MLIAHIIAFLALVFASKVDLEIREVPDLLSYGLIGVGIFLGIANTIYAWSWSPIITMLIGLGIGFLIGCIMYYAGQWGGGDAKLLMGLGALFGATMFFYQFLLFLVIAGAVYGMGYSIYLAIKHRKEFKIAFHKRAYSKPIKRIRYTFQAIIILALLLAFFVLEEFSLRIIVVILTAGAYMLFYLLLFSKTLEEVCMHKRIRVNKLVEGDWVIEKVTIGKKVLDLEKTGISKEQIALLKKHHIKTVLVKEGIPFVPSFLLAYVCALLALQLDFAFIIPLL